MTQKVLLDSSFIISCVELGLDFFDELESHGFKILIPIEVIREVQKLSGFKKNMSKRENANLVLKILKANKFEEIELGKGHVDKRIIEFSKKNPDIFIATLDQGIKRQIQNRKVIIRAMKKIEVQ